jgi:hypothetical protein
MLCRLLSASPPDGFFLVNMLALLGTLAAATVIGRQVSPHSSAQAWAAALAVFGTSAFHHGPLQAVVNRLPKIYLDERTSPYHKFMHPNSSPLGIVAFVCFLALLLRTLGRERVDRLSWALLFLCTAAAAFLYPIIWLAFPPVAVTAVVVIQRRDLVRRWNQALAVLVPVAAGSLVAFPYLISISAGKPEAARFAFRLRPGFIAANLVSMSFLVCLPAVLAWSRRKLLATLTAEQTRSLHVLVSAAATCGLLGLVLSLPQENQYKYLLLCGVAVGLAVVPFLHSLSKERPALALLFLVAVILPTADFLAEFCRPWESLDAVRGQGTALTTLAPADAKLYTWIRSTPADAVFVDSYLTIPALGQRPLFVGTDLRREQAHGRDGWGMRANTILLEIDGQDAGAVQTRRDLCQTILRSPDGPAISRALAQTSADCGGRPLFIVARGSEGSRLERVTRLHLAASFESARVYRYTGV